MRQRVLTTNTRLLQRTQQRPSNTQQKRNFSARLFPQPPVDPRGGKLRTASTSASNTDWLGWLKKAPLTVGKGDTPRRALIFAGLVSWSWLTRPASDSRATQSLVIVNSALTNPGELPPQTDVANPVVHGHLGGGVRSSYFPRCHDRVLGRRHGRVRRRVPWGRWPRHPRMAAWLGRGAYPCEYY
jgi:hypothetical protein